MAYSFNSISNIFSSIKRMESMAANIPMHVQGSTPPPVDSSSYQIPASADALNKQNVFMFGSDKWGVSRKVVGE